MFSWCLGPQLFHEASGATEWEWKQVPDEKYYVPLSSEYIALSDSPSRGDMNKSGQSTEAELHCSAWLAKTMSSLGASDSRKDELIKSRCKIKWRNYTFWNQRNYALSRSVVNLGNCGALSSEIHMES